jgi:uncharacterized protein
LQKTTRLRGIFEVFRRIGFFMMEKRYIPFCILVLLCLSLPSWFFQEANGKVATVPALQPKDLMEVKISRLLVDPANMQPVVLLADSAGERAIPIWIGPNEANAIQGEIEGAQPPRPLTHDLLERVIQRLNGTVKRVIITHQKENIYFAVIVIERDRILLEIDARPSDSLVLALKFKSPIFIARSLFKERSISLGESKETDFPYGLTLQELTPMLAESFGFKKGRGVLIADVKGGSRGEKDGLQRGDIVVGVGGDKISDVVAMKNALAQIKNSVKIKIFRQGNFLVLTLNPAN